MTIDADNVLFCWPWIIVLATTCPEPIKTLLFVIAGVCKGKFNTMFDWVRRNDRGKYIFNTYFFRQDNYWMYENHANRTRYGDPLPITSEWRGVPNEPDGYAHVLVLTTENEIVDDAYFFKGKSEDFDI